MLVDGEWGGICDDGFTITEGDVLCHQQGFKLGAEKVRIKLSGDTSGSVKKSSPYFHTCFELVFSNKSVHFYKKKKSNLPLNSCTPDIDN